MLHVPTGQLERWASSRAGAWAGCPCACPYEENESGDESGRFHRSSRTRLLWRWHPNAAGDLTEVDYFRLPTDSGKRAGGGTLDNGKVGCIGTLVILVILGLIFQAAQRYGLPLGVAACGIGGYLLYVNRDRSWRSNPKRLGVGLIVVGAAFAVLGFTGIQERKESAVAAEKHAAWRATRAAAERRELIDRCRSFDVKAEVNRCVAEYGMGPEMGACVGRVDSRAQSCREARSSVPAITDAPSGPTAPNQTPAQPPQYVETVPTVGATPAHDRRWLRCRNIVAAVMGYDLASVVPSEDDQGYTAVEVMLPTDRPRFRCRSAVGNVEWSIINEDGPGPWNKLFTRMDGANMTIYTDTERHTFALE